MSDKVKRNALVLKIEYHREMAFALEEDASSKSDFILKKEQHEKVKQLTGGTDMRESLKIAARTHREKEAQYVKEFKELYPDLDHNIIFDNNMDWMMDEIASKQDPLEDPELQAK